LSYVPYKKGTYPNFWQRPMSDIAYYNQYGMTFAKGMTAVWPVLPGDWYTEEKQTELETENK